ncbi:hypothetical protein ACWKTZ_21330 [Bacillus cereus]
MEKISQSILNLRDEYIQNQYVNNYQEINRGWCVAFAEEIESIFQNCEVISNDFLMKDLDEGWNGNEDDDWDINQLMKYNSPSPINIQELKNKIRGYHRWIYYDGKHFDAECPYGVKNLFELPFFKSHLEDN